MMIYNGEVYYFDGYEYVPAGLTEKEFFSQFTQEEDEQNA